MTGQHPKILMGEPESPKHFGNARASRKLWDFEFCYLPKCEFSRDSGEEQGNFSLGWKVDETYKQKKVCVLLRIAVKVS